MILHGIDGKAKEASEAFQAKQTKESGSDIFAGRAGLQVDLDYINSAKLTPKCFIEEHTYADVAVISAPGGTGKTTIILREAISLALGTPLWGLKVLNPGWTLIVTAEDQRERLIARLREIANSMPLAPGQREEIFEKVCILDVTDKRDFKLTRMEDGNIVHSPLVDGLIDGYKDDPPALVIFDPLVSFGVGESKVNENEQELISVARRIISGLECCVRFVHHTGKQSARDKAVDQYSSRGGSALPDGSRMVTVLSPWSESDKATEKPPQGLHCGPDDSITILHRPKLSYTKPNLPKIWIKRTGFAFEHFNEIPIPREQQDKAHADQIVVFVEEQIKLGNYHTKRTLEAICEDIGMTRMAMRKALAITEASGDLIQMNLPSALRQGGRKNFLCPASMSGDVSFKMSGIAA